MKSTVKSAITLCAGLVLGSLGFWGYRHLTEGPATSDGPRQDADAARPELVGGSATVRGEVGLGERGEVVTSANLASRAVGTYGANSEAASRGTRNLPGMPGGPIFSEEAPVFSEAAPETVSPTAGRPSADRGAFRRLEPGSPPVSGTRSTIYDARLDANRFDDERRLAMTTFDAGNQDLGKRLLRQVYVVWKGKPNVDLTPEVQRLLQIEDQFLMKRDYIEYLAGRASSESFFLEQLARGDAALETVAADRSRATQAWSELSLAYELASDHAQRAQVLARLGPFVDTFILAGKPSPLLKTHAVSPGDNLSKIAKRYQTTPLAIKRLNRLKSDTIRPKQRLRILSGTIRIHIDKSDYRLWATVDHRFLLEMPVGLGRHDGTPVGEFVIKIKEKDPAWWRPGSAAIPAGDPRNILGTRWIGFAEKEDYSGFGIHGTDDPSSVGQQSSAGCVRMVNDDVEVLYDFVPYRTKVYVRQ